MISGVLDRWRLSSIARCFHVLDGIDRKKLLAISILEICMSALDLMGVATIGLLASVSISGLQSQAPGNRVISALRFLHISESSFQTQAISLGVLALALLVGRTVLSIFFTRRILFFLSRRGARISSTLISQLLAQPLLVVQARTTQQISFAVTTGVAQITLYVLATAIVLVSDVSLLLVMSVGLFMVDPATAVGTFLIFAFVGYFLYRFMHIRAGALGVKQSDLTIVSNEKIIEVFNSYRELVVRNRRDYYAREIGKLRFTLADVSAESAFMPYVSKYVIETTVILGAVLLGAAQFILYDLPHAVATLSIFMAAGSRMAPAVLRVQQALVQIQSSLGQAAPTLKLIDELGNVKFVEDTDDSLDLIHDGFIAEIQIRNVSLTYPNKPMPAISNVNLVIPSGVSVAFVGPSGAGKTTITDILLGVLNPDQGDVLISGLPPLLAIAKWPGAVSYVPQDIVISIGTIRENVTLGYPSDVVSDDLVMSALKIAHLDRFVNSLPFGLDTQVGERGTKISGGQRQRLGIARAMFTQPHLLVLDEATSSLDGEAEANISDAIHAMRGSTTVVLIAHRLSTVKSADIVVYLAEGKVVATGTFDEVRCAVSDFDRQAKLMGL